MRSTAPLVALCLICFFCISNVCSAAMDTSVHSSHHNVSSVVTTAEGVAISRMQWEGAKSSAKKFTSNVFRYLLRIMISFDIEGLRVSPMCLGHLIYAAKGFRDMDLWALKMLDAAGKIPNGLFSGTVTTYGDYDSCLRVNANGKFRGKYCMIEISPKSLPELLNAAAEFVDEDDEALQLAILVGSSLEEHAHLTTSLCIPSSCSTEDMQNLANQGVKNLPVGIKVNVRNCEAKEFVKFDAVEISAIAILCVVGLAAVMGTVTDVGIRIFQKRDPLKTNSGVLARVLVCFSFYSNTKRLVRKDDSPDSIRIFHGMQFITELWVILGNMIPILNAVEISSGINGLDIIKLYIVEVLLNVFYSADTFIFISGVLVMYNYMKLKDEDFSVSLYVSRRLWRLTPPIFFLTAIWIITPRFGTGPIWKSLVTSEVAKCRDNWWTNLLFINNYGEYEKSCLPWTWYFAAQFQLSLFALVVLLPMTRSARSGMTVLAISAAVSISILILNTTLNDLPPTLWFDALDESTRMRYVERAFLWTHVHLITYCIGMAVAYVICTRPELRISTRFNALGWVAAAAVYFSLIFATHEWTWSLIKMTLKSPGPVASALYVCATKLAWGFFLAWVTVTCFTGNGGVATKFLSWSVFVPLSRLTFAVYLVHPVIYQVYRGSARGPMNADVRSAVFTYVALVCTSYVTAYIFGMLFEYPFTALERNWLNRSSDDVNLQVNDAKTEENGDAKTKEHKKKGKAYETKEIELKV